MRFPAVLLLLPLSSCSVWFFSGESWVDRSQPVALVETVGGVELGATTEFGVLLLGRTATEGPCRVHYFLGPTPMIEDGELSSTGSMFTVAEIDLKTMSLRVLDRCPNSEDPLIVMWTPDGTHTEQLSVQLAAEPGIKGDVLQHPGSEVPIGAAVFAETDEGLLFVGLVAGKAEVADQGAVRQYFVFAGVDRLREMLAIPTPHPTDFVPKYRTDDISVMKPLK